MKKIILLILILLVFVAFLFTTCRVRVEPDAEPYEPVPVPPDTEPYEPEDIEPEPEPPEARFETASRHTTVSLSAYHALAVLDDGSLYAWGGGGWGAGLLGDGTNHPSSHPVKIMDHVIHAVAEHSHSLAIVRDGSLWAWGQNNLGQIGDGTNETRLYPVKVMENVVYAAISPGRPNSHMSWGARSFAITEDGTLWAWGQNGPFEETAVLGDGTMEQRNYPVPIMTNVVSVTPTLTGGFAVTEDGTIWGWSREQLYPVPIPHPPYAHDYRRMPEFRYDLTEDGTLWTWGLNQPPDHWQWFPLVGDGTTVPRPSPVRVMDGVKSVTIVADTVFAITQDGALWSWGYNTIGQVGDGTTHPRLSPVRILDGGVASVFSSYFIDHGRIGFMNSLALTEDGSLYAWGCLRTGLREGNPQLYPTRMLDGVRVLPRPEPEPRRSIADFRPRTEDVILTEGLPQTLNLYPFGANPDRAAGLAGFVIFISDLFKVEQQHNLIRAMAIDGLWDTNIPILEIKQIPNTTLDYAIEQLLYRGDLAVDYDPETFPFAVLFPLEHPEPDFDGTNQYPLTYYFLKDNGSGGVFSATIKFHMGVYALTGHPAAHLVHALMTLEVF